VSRVVGEVTKGHLTIELVSAELFAPATWCSAPSASCDGESRDLAAGRDSALAW